MARYTVPVCVYDMVETVERSLRSVLDQVGDRYDFEVVVVDGGSTDGTVDVLDRLADEYGALRVVALEPDPDRHLGADRHRSIREAGGEYVLPQLDADDVYEPVVEDFVSVYHDLEAGREDPFLLSGTGINCAPRELLVEVPYRNLRSAEDRDLWRRLHAEDAIVWLDHGPVRSQIGYEKTLGDRLRRDWSDKRADAQAGLSLASCLRWSLSHPGYYVLEERRGPVGTVAKRLYDLVTYPLAFAAARGDERFGTPAPMDRCGALEARIHGSRRTLSELEADLGVTVDRGALSERGLELLDV
jgi:glycosyltransferase involved in cell wall biosynthesis